MFFMIGFGLCEKAAWGGSLLFFNENGRFVAITLISSCKKQ